MEKLNISRKGRKEGDEIILTSTFTEKMKINDFNERLIKQFHETENLDYQLNILKSKINRLSEEVKETPELREFLEKLKEAEKLKELDKLKETAKEIESQLEVAKKDRINLRLIQSDLKLIKEKDIVKSKTVGE